MGLRINKAPFKLSEYTSEDSESNAFLKSHAYKAVGPGTVYASVMLTTGNNNLIVYVGTTSNPAGEGLAIQKCSLTVAASNEWRCVTAKVAKGEYFEITSSSGTPAIKWKSFGTLKKPIDFN